MLINLGAARGCGHSLSSRHLTLVLVNWYTSLLVFSPMVSLACLRTIQNLFTPWTLLHLLLCSFTGCTSPFKGLSLEGLTSRILHPAWKCSPHVKQCMQLSSVLCCWQAHWRAEARSCLGKSRGCIVLLGHIMQLKRSIRSLLVGAHWWPIWLHLTLNYFSFRDSLCRNRTLWWGKSWLLQWFSEVRYFSVLSEATSVLSSYSSVSMLEVDFGTLSCTGFSTRLN